MLTDIQIQLSLLELASSYLKMTSSYRPVFVQYLQDEYAGIDDENAETIDVVVSALYDFQLLMQDDEQGTMTEGVMMTQAEIQHRADVFINDLTERLVILVVYQHEDGNQHALSNLATLLDNMAAYAKDCVDVEMASVTSCSDDDDSMSGYGSSFCGSSSDEEKE